MFKNKVATMHLPDFIFLFAIGFLNGAVLKEIYPYDKVWAISAIILLAICFLAYLWKFFITSIEEESIDPSKTSLKNNLKLKIPVKKFFEA